MIVLVLVGILISGCAKQIETPSETYCETDEDCMEVCLDCCTCRNEMIVLSKQYVSYMGIDPNSNCSGITYGPGCPVTPGRYPVCEKNKCVSIFAGECSTESDCVSSQDYGCVNKNFCDRIPSCKSDGEWACIYCKNGFCSDDMID